MTIVNQHWITFGGAPVTGRVPSQLLVMNGGSLTEQQRGAVLHAYKLFTDAAEVAITDYMVQNRVLQDGSQVRMTATNMSVPANRIDVVMVWPAGMPATPDDPARGFVVSPRWITGQTPTAKLDHDFLTAFKEAFWKPVRTLGMGDYRPGQKRTSLRYFVKGKRTAPSTKADARYSDVYIVWNGALYKNAKPVQAFPGSVPAGVPVVLGLSGSYKPVFVDDYSIAAWDTSGPGAPTFVTGFTWFTYYSPIVSGDMLMPGIEIRNGPDLDPDGDPIVRVNYLGLNITPTGNTQAWRTTAKLKKVAPFVDIESQAFQQIGGAGILNSFTGWTTSELGTAGPGAYMYGGPLATFIGYEYADGGSYDYYLTGPVNAAGIALGTGNTDTYHFDKVYDVQESLDLNGSEAITLARTLTIHADFKYQMRNWDLLSPAGMHIVGGGVGGGPSGKSYSETKYTRNESDVGTCAITVPGMPYPIFDVAATHAMNGSNGYCTEPHEFVPPTPTYGDHWRWASTGALLALDSVRTVGRTFGGDVETNTIHAKSLDVIFSDRQNEVYVWIEAEVTSNATDWAAQQGSSSMAIRWCVSFRGIETKKDIYTAAYDTPQYLPAMSPWGINFGTSDLGFNYQTLTRPFPGYVPRWQDQGLCPYIAYTTKEEAGRGVTPRIAAHFRVQLTHSHRALDEPDQVFAPNVIGFELTMAQNLLGTYCSILAARNVLVNLESQVIVISHSAPDPRLFKHIGAPIDDVNQFAEIYRT